MEIIVEISGSVREEFFPLPFLIRTKKKKMSLSSDPQAFLRSFGEKKTFDCALWRCFRLIKTSWRIIPQYRLLDFFLCIRVDCSSSRRHLFPLLLFILESALKSFVTPFHRFSDLIERYFNRYLEFATWLCLFLWREEVSRFTFRSKCRPETWPNQLTFPLCHILYFNISLELYFFLSIEIDRIIPKRYFKMFYLTDLSRRVKYKSSIIARIPPLLSKVLSRLPKGRGGACTTCHGW